MTRHYVSFMSAEAVSLMRRWSWITRLKLFCLSLRPSLMGEECNRSPDSFLWLVQTGFKRFGLHRLSTALTSALVDLRAGLGPKRPASHIMQYHCRQRKLRNQIFRHYKGHYCVNTRRVLKGEVRSRTAFLQVLNFKHENNHTDVNESLMNLKLNTCFVGLRLGHSLAKFSPWFFLTVQLGQPVPRHSLLQWWLMCNELVSHTTFKFFGKKRWVTTVEMQHWPKITGRLICCHLHPPFMLMNIEQICVTFTTVNHYSY